MPPQDPIPLFPLQLVLLPDMPLPLHIFEERYKLMAGDCLRDRKPFGIVYYDGSDIQRVGCTALITHVLNRYEDGRLDILASGKDRFQIGEFVEGKPFLEAKVEYFKDREEAVDGDLINLGRAAVRELEKLALFTGEVFDGAALSRLTLENLSFVVASAEGITLEEKQRFLEMTMTRDRLKEGTGSLKNLTVRLYWKSQLKRFFGNEDPASGTNHL